MSKKIVVNTRAFKELELFPRQALVKAQAYLELLAKKSSLEEPTAKKIGTNLFEIRIKSQGEWRVLYAYILTNSVVILSAFHKKTQKTPKKEVDKARKRLREYNA